MFGGGGCLCPVPHASYAPETACLLSKFLPFGMLGTSAVRM